MFEGGERDLEEILETYRGRRHICNIAGIGATIAPGRRKPLLHLMSACRYARAKLPLDHMYAILGISRERHDPELAPDYGLSLGEAIQRYADFFVRNGWLYPMLCQIDSQAWMKELPTWIPNWCDSSADLPWLQSWCDYGERLKYCAGGSNNAIGSFDCINPKHLHVRGMVFDSVAVLGDDERRLKQQNYDLIGYDHTQFGYVIVDNAHQLIEIARDGCKFETDAAYHKTMTGVLLAGFYTETDQ
jgi:hypothetical protein